MDREENEEVLLRSVALENAQSILRARRQAEEELVKAKEALEQKSRELDRSLAMIRATLESATDGILVTDGAGKVTGFNKNFIEMWGLSVDDVDGRNHREILQITSEYFDSPSEFLARVDDIYIASPSESYDLLELNDGRVIERFSRIQFVEKQNVGRVWSFRDITERRHAEDALAKQSESWRVTLASIGDAVITTDTLGRVTYLNGVAESLTGWAQDEAVGQPLEKVFRIITEQTREPSENPVTKVLREGTIVGLANHTVLISKDGTERPIDDSAAPIRNEKGTVTGVVMIFRDVTEQRRTVRTIEQSEARKTAMFETAVDCIISIDHTGIIIEFNAAAERTFGHPRENVLGRELAEVIIPEEYRERHRQSLANHVAGGEARILNQRIQLSALRADGTEFPVELTVTRLPGDGPLQFTAYLRDITEIKDAEAAAGRLAAIVESSDDAIISKGLDGVVRSWNKSAERMFGYRADEAIGRHISFLFPADRLHEEDRILDRLRKGERLNHFDTVRLRRDGQPVHVSLTISPVFDASGRIVGVSKIARDISERIGFEDELRRYAAELSEADRRKNEFLAMLAHELRNPLAPISNALPIMRLSADENKDLQLATDMIERQVGQLVRLVDDLLDVSRITRGKIELRREKVELASIIYQAVEAARPSCETGGVILDVKQPESAIYIDGDSARLNQVVGNLLNNACKFTNEGGRIDLSVTEENGSAVIRVKDTGIGIAAEQLPVIFDMFVQGDTSLERAVSGLGIGLTLVKNLVEMHDGTVSAASDEIGKGSEFIVRIPVLKLETATKPPIGMIEPEISKMGKLRILVVDDNIDSAESLALLLEFSGHVAAMAYDGRAAVEMASSFDPEVILLDIGLPKLNGYEAARAIRELPRGKEISLIALTGWGQQEDRDRSKKAGFDGHMVKPVDHVELMKWLEKISAEKDATSAS